jgi:phosphate transport system substrate-binding protein
MNRHRWTSLSLLLWTTVLHSQNVRPDPAIPTFHASKLAAGQLHVTGEDSMENLIHAWVDAFRSVHPEIYVVLDLKSSTKISTALTDGTADVGISGLDLSVLKADEQPFEARYHHPLWGVVVSGATFDDPQRNKPTAIAVNPANPIDRISLAQLDAIFSTTRRRGHSDITTWGQLGLTGEWANYPIKLYGIKGAEGQPLVMGNTAFFVDRVMRGGDFKEGVHRFANLGKARSFDLEAEAIANDPGAIGAVTFSSTKTVKLIAVSEDDGGTAFKGTREEVAAQQYPLGRDVYAFINREGDSPVAPAVREFLAFLLSRDGQQVVASTHDFQPLPAKVVSREHRKLM